MSQAVIYIWKYRGVSPTKDPRFLCSWVRSDYRCVSGMQEHYILWSPDNGDAAKTNKQNHHHRNLILMAYSPYLCGNSGHPSTGAAEDFTGARRLLASWRVSRRGVFCSQ